MEGHTIRGSGGKFPLIVQISLADLWRSKEIQFLLYVGVPSAGIAHTHPVKECSATASCAINLTGGFFRVTKENIADRFVKPKLNELRVGYEKLRGIRADESLGQDKTSQTANVPFFLIKISAEGKLLVAPLCERTNFWREVANKHVSMQENSRT